MTLSGNLDFVPLDDVLRLLTKAGSDGAVEITGGAVEGRIYVSGNGIGMATTLADHTLREHLISSGYITDENLKAIERGDMSASNLGDTGDSFTNLLREMTVESIYQMESHGSEFQVVKDASSPYATGMPFDLETVLRDSQERADRWMEVSKVIHDLDAPMQINRDLVEKVVELDAEAWRLIAEIGSGSSVRQLSSRLGTTDFAIARVAADLTTRGLLVTRNGSVSVSTPDVDDFNFDAVAEAAVTELPVSDATAIHSGDAEASATVVEEPIQVPDPQKSWWEEPEDDTATAPSSSSEASAVEEDTNEADAAVKDAFAADEDSDFFKTTAPAVFDTPVETIVNEVSDDSDAADAFLEKVFSELGPEESEENEGHGLMRRRRMGSILRELDED